MNSAATHPVAAGWRWFFLVAGLYDVVLGVIFLVAGERLLDAIGMTLPPHVAYIQLAAVFVAIQGLSYLIAWTDPLANVGIVWVGVAYKAGYAGLAFWYLAIGDLPSVFFVPWAIADLAFMVGFLWFIRTARQSAA